jgi:hypothetical protein
MGGGGGGYRVGPSDIEDIKRDVEKRTEESMQEAEINDLLSRELVQINFRDAAKINQYLEALEDALGEKIEVEKLLFGGSIAKHTYVDGLSDVDSLVVLKGDEASELDPGEARTRLCEALRANLAKADVKDISVGNMAVTVTYNDDTEIQLLAAREHKGETEISSADGKSWKRINPRQFADTLTRLNQQQNGGVVPTIKLAKGIIDNLSADAQLSGYHVEALAVAAFSGYNGEKNNRAMLTQFFSAASEAIAEPINDVTGQSAYIDESLGSAGSAGRTKARAELKRVADAMEKAKSASDWGKILGNES